MSYPGRYYQMQQSVMADVRLSHRSGLCPICKQRPSATWPDGVRRITCGEEGCFLRWLPVHSRQPQSVASQQPPAVVIDPTPSLSPNTGRLRQSTRSALGRLWLHVGAHWFLPATTVSDAGGRRWIAANIGPVFEEMAPGYLVRFRPDVAYRLASIHASHTFYRRSKAEIDQMWSGLLDDIHATRSAP